MLQFYNMNYYLIAGEASGDLHGSNLIKEIKKQDPEAHFRCWGGDLMQNAGGQIIKHYRELAFMGFIEVIANLKTILSNIRFCKADIQANRPDVLVLIDYPGFNLRIAKWAKALQLKVVFYISPQVWAWKENRVKTIKQCVDRMIVILPFEKAFYAKWNYEVDYVGHPLSQVVDDFKQNNNVHIAALIPSYNASQSNGIVALLPGSRKQEILKKLPLMLEASKHFPEYHFVVAKAPSVEDIFYTGLTQEFKNVSVVENKTYALLSVSSAALVTSGTATLETALFDVPELICYKGSAISYQIAKRLIDIKFIGLVNLIMDKEVVKELIQNELTVTNITTELKKILYHEPTIKKVKEDYAALRKLLRLHGNASENAAKIITETARK